VVDSSDILNAAILIVDDQDVNVLLLDRILRSAGYTSITSTKNPLEVCELHRTHRYDLILLDLLMPGMDGFQVIESLKTIETDGYVPVLVITAEPAHKLRALKAGAKDFISKPFDMAEVLARVHNMLEVRLLHQEAKRLYDEVLAEQKRSIELSAQPGAMVGVEREERLATPLFRSLRLRHPWLQLNLLTAFAAGSMVYVFHGIIERAVILAMFLPVLAGQSGNTGCQTLAVTLRGVFLGELKSGAEKALIIKESLLGLMNGALVGLVAAVVMYVAATLQQVPAAFMLGLVVFLAMTGSCVISSICGAIVPLALKKLGADPSTASSIFLTTATDIVSMGMLLGLATLLVK
jgi:DNA-binding response OmpR family regulator/cation transporter-like permease